MPVHQGVRFSVSDMVDAARALNITNDAFVGPNNILSPNPIVLNYTQERQVNRRPNHTTISAGQNGAFYVVHNFILNYILQGGSQGGGVGLQGGSQGGNNIVAGQGVGTVGGQNQQQGLPNSNASQLRNSSIPITGGGADIPRGATSSQGLGVDIQSEFLGVNDSKPDLSTGAQFSPDAENVDGAILRGTVSKRGGLIPVFPDKDETVDSVVVDDTYRGRSINVLPAAFRDGGKAFVVTGHDLTAAVLGSGTSTVNNTRLRGAPTEINYHSQYDISRVKPEISTVAAVATQINFDVEMAEKFRRQTADDNSLLQSVNELIIVASKNGFCHDRDALDKLSEDIEVLEVYTDWDGNSKSISHTGLTTGETWYYTIWAVNKRETTRPAFFSEVVT